MIYGSLQTEFMEAKYNSHIDRYGTPIRGKIVVNIYELNMLAARRYNLIRHAKCSSYIESNIFSNFCCIPCLINSCMEEVQVGVMNNTTRLKWGESQFTCIEDSTFI